MIYICPYNGVGMYAWFTRGHKNSDVKIVKVEYELIWILEDPKDRGKMRIVCFNSNLNNT